ncbi:type IV secretion protein Rhs [Cryobacterium sp. TMT1-3]|nr:type IV secretion protein Rhs [Cryobacterium sp. TMT1-3]
MSRGRVFVLVAVVSVVAMLFTSLPAVAAPVSPLASRSLPPGVEYLPPTEFDEVWSPSKDAAKGAAGESNAPPNTWATPLATRSLSNGSGGTANRAPAGTVVGAPGLGALPHFAFDEANVSNATVARVNLANGNLLLTSNDGVLNGPALAVRNDRFYNGLSSSEGSLGGGWSSPLSAFDVGLAVTSSTATYTGANGFKAVFTKSGEAWVTPSGFNATLTEQPYTKTVTFNRTGEQFVFNSSGWITKNLNRNGEGTTYSYDPSTGTVSTVTEAAGRSYSVTWAGGSRISQIVDSAGRTTTYTANGAGQLSRVDSPGGLWEEYDYDATGRISELRARGTNAAATSRTLFGYDTQHRLTSIKRGLASSSTFLTTASYVYTAGQTVLTNGRGKMFSYAIDASGRMTSVTDPLNRTRSQSYAANSDVVTVTDAFATGGIGGNTTTYSYDALNNAVSATLPTGAAASAAYGTGVGCAGTGGTVFQAKCSTDAAGNGKAFEYDAKGNPTKVTDSTAGGTGAVPQRFTYENGGAVCGGFDGQVCTTKDGKGNTTAYTYDGNGNLSAVTPPAPQGATSYTYDSLGRVLTVNDGNSDTTTYAYNLRDDLALSTFQGGQTLTTTFYSNGIKNRDTDSTGPFTQYTYDALGRIINYQTIVTSTVNQEFDYDAAGNITRFRDAMTGEVNYIYDDANQLTQLTEPLGTCPVAAGSPTDSGCIKFAYDANGAETLRTLPGNATVATVNDAASRATRITAKDGAGVIKADIGYSYTVPGGTADRTNIQTRTSYLEQGISAGAISTYGYDSLSRLTTATEKLGAAATASWAYTYDPAGNRTQQVRAGATGATAGTTAYSYNAANQITAATGDTTTWTYDAAGNQTQNGLTGQTATYNARGAVTAIDATTYTALGQGNANQLSRSASSTTYLNGPLGLASEKLGTANRGFTRTPTGQALGVHGTSTKYYYAQDSLGSVIGLFDKTGAYMGGYSYSPYGEARATGTNTATAYNHLRYISGYYDDATNLYKLGARNYDPTIGRFTQYDPSGQEAHPYAYASCNPINAKDPSGLGAFCTFAPLAVAALGFLTAQVGLTAAVLAITGVGAPAAAVVGLVAAALGVETAGIGLIILSVCTLRPDL